MVLALARSSLLPRLLFRLPPSTTFRSRLPPPASVRAFPRNIRAMSSSASDVEAAMRKMFTGTTWAIENDGKPNYAEGSIFIRPSGNPIDIKEWGEFMKDMETEIVDITEVIKTKILGDVAYITFRTREKFSYKGNSSDDTAVVTGILIKKDGEWVIEHVQRSSGTPAS